MLLHYPLLFLVSCVYAQRTCLNTVVPPGNLRNAAIFAHDLLADSGLADIFLHRKLMVNVFYHVIQAGPTVAEGKISPETVKKQHAVLNDDFRHAGIKFRHVGTDYTTNANWFLRADDDEVEKTFKYALRKGSYRTLNVYFVQTELLGWATFPVDVEKRTNHDIRMDGVVVNHASVPGGAMENFDLGKTLTHEVGHWLDLYHTFSGGCSEVNDFITDTPAEKSAAFGCPVGRDTCTGEEFQGKDPIHNYMDYSDDACMTEFTPGQIIRFHQSWEKYRAPSRCILLGLGCAG